MSYEDMPVIFSGEPLDEEKEISLEVDRMKPVIYRVEIGYSYMSAIFDFDNPDDAALFLKVAAVNFNHELCNREIKIWMECVSEDESTEVDEDENR